MSLDIFDTFGNQQMFIYIKTINRDVIIIQNKTYPNFLMSHKSETKIKYSTWCFKSYGQQQKWQWGTTGMLLFGINLTYNSTVNHIKSFIVCIYDHALQISHCKRVFSLFMNDADFEPLCTEDVICLFVEYQNLITKKTKFVK